MPLHFWHAPKGELNENIRGSSSGSAKLQLGQENFSENKWSFSPSTITRPSAKFKLCSTAVVILDFRLDMKTSFLKSLKEIFNWSITTDISCLLVLIRTMSVFRSISFLSIFAFE